MNLNKEFDFKEIAVIVAHPDDETLWVGGMMLMNPDCDWTVISLCRGSDADRAPKFFKVLKRYGAKGAMGDLDDGPEQTPLPKKEMEELIPRLLPKPDYDLIITHSPAGEYTRHRRHEETGMAVLFLWENKKINSRQLWFFAYEDGDKTYYPRAIQLADRVVPLPENIRLEKYDILTKTYGFSIDSFEALTTPEIEAFWHYGQGEKRKEIRKESE